MIADYYSEIKIARPVFESVTGRQCTWTYKISRFLFFGWSRSAIVDFQIYNLLVANRFQTTNVHRHTNFIKICQMIAKISHLTINGGRPPSWILKKLDF